MYPSLIVVTIYTMLFSANAMNGQNFVTEPKNVILGHLDSQGIKYRVDMASDGSGLIHFKDGEITLEYHLDKEGICTVYRMQFPEKGLKESIDALNSTFTKIKEGVWREFDGERYFIWSLQKNDSGYSISVVTETRLKDH